jgi:hypothetical protein
MAGASIAGSRTAPLNQPAPEGGCRPVWAPRLQALAASLEVGGPKTASVKAATSRDDAALFPGSAFYYVNQVDGRPGKKNGLRPRET